MTHGETVAAFEKEFAAYVGAEYCIALCNGTATLHTALVALGLEPGERVVVPPLTMSSTTIAVLHAGGTPRFVDVEPDTWVMSEEKLGDTPFTAAIPVSLYGLCPPRGNSKVIEDAAQTLRQHYRWSAFTSYSFQASKILSCGEGGSLVTNDEGLATKARQFSSLGYQLDPRSPRIDSSKIRSPDYARHHSLGWNYRMSDTQAAVLLQGLGRADQLLAERREAAALYQGAVKGVSWLQPQHVPEGWTHDYWTYAVALAPPADTRQPYPLWGHFANMIEHYGGERPYACWLPVYREPFYVENGVNLMGSCPVAESLQPRLMQFATNRVDSAMQNARALSMAIKEIGG